jgi:hypothetical protein
MASWSFGRFLDQERQRRAEAQRTSRGGGDGRRCVVSIKFVPQTGGVTSHDFDISIGKTVHEIADAVERYVNMHDAFDVGYGYSIMFRKRELRELPEGTRGHELLLGTGYMAIYVRPMGPDGRPAKRAESVAAERERIKRNRFMDAWAEWEAGNRSDARELTRDYTTTPKGGPDFPGPGRGNARAAGRGIRGRRAGGTRRGPAGRTCRGSRG